MKSYLLKWTGIVALAFAGAGAWAQEGADSGAAVKVTKIPTLTQVKQKTPANFNAGVPPSRAKEWGVFDVEFDVKVDAKQQQPWVDEMSATFYVLMQNPKDAKQPYSFFQLTSRYRDIEKGKSKVSAILIPAAMSRFGNIIGLAVELSVGGKVVDTSDVKSGDLTNRKEWWKDSAVTDGEKTVKRTGYLLDRSKTPFGLVGYDDYEVEIQ